MSGRNRMPYFMLLSAFVLGIIALMTPSQSTAQTKMPVNTLRSPVTLKDEGTFFVNGQVVVTNFPNAPATGAPIPGHVMIDQMFVHYRIPIFAKRYPIIFVHGGGLTGQEYETTPDGREGWAQYFVQNGYSVYVVDFPGRGRSGFDSTAINQAVVQKNVALVPAIQRTTAESAWTTFRFGPSYGVPYPGLKFPIDSIDGLLAQNVPYTEVTLQGGALTQAPLALAALLDQIGPAILLVHSQSGPFADAVVGLRPNLVKATINVEGNQLTIPTAQQIAAYKNVSDIEVFGDHVVGNTASTGQDRLNGRTAVSNAINAAGGSSEVVQLPSVGLHGNSHMMMQDKNNLKVADFLMRWLDKHVDKKHHDH